ncbi:MAG: hypothetical protein Fur0022_08140 [Anaerolineales bacterium]
MSYTGFANGDVDASILRVDDVKFITTVCDTNPQGGPIIVNVTTQNDSTPTPLPPTLTPTPTNTPAPTATPTPTATAPGDPYEPNETYNTAYNLDDDIPGEIDLDEIYTFFNAKISTSIDKDWFMFEVPGDLDNCLVYELTTTLEDIPTGTNYDLELYGTDPFNPLDDSKNSGNVDEIIVYGYEPDPSGDVFRVRIYSASGSNPSQPYLFSLQVTCNLALAYEPNDKLGEAYELLLPNNEKILVKAALWPATDEDWFKVYLTPGVTDPPAGSQLLTLWLAVPDGVDYQLALYRANGQLISVSTQPEGIGEYISYQISHLGWYYVRIYINPISEDVSAEAYQLELLYTP